MSIPEISTGGRAMKPTGELRFIERTQDQGDGTVRRVRVLQQAWVSINGGYGDWRDVPLVVDDEAS